MRQPVVRRRARVARGAWSTLPVARVLRALVPTLLLLLLAGGCTRGARENVTPQEPPELRVENRAFLDMTVYVLRGTQRVRLGQVSGNSTATLRIPGSLLTGPTPLRFLADPIGSSRTPISSEIVVTPGEEVVLTIPPG